MCSRQYRLLLSHYTSFSVVLKAVYNRMLLNISCEHSERIEFATARNMR